MFFVRFYIDFKNASIWYASVFPRVETTKCTLHVFKLSVFIKHSTIHVTFQTKTLAVVDALAAK